MFRVFLLIPLLAVLACGDRTPVAPEQVLSPENALATSAKRANTPKLVSLKLKGDWWIGDAESPELCEEFPGSFPTYPTWEGNGTHLGRTHGSATNCLSIQPDGSYFIHLQSGVMVAANGDRIYMYGRADTDGTRINVGADGSFDLGPVPFVGGTGRFENVTGYYHIYGFLGGGAFRATGMISTVGSSR